MLPGDELRSHILRSTSCKQREKPNNCCDVAVRSFHRKSIVPVKSSFDDLVVSVAAVVAAEIVLLNPKSPIRTTISLVSMMFCGLRSK